MSIEQLDPSVEVVHLRHLLDIQPSCLMRLGGDGVVLAANDAALTMLGMQSCQQALGRTFAAWISQDQRERWHAFTVQVIGGSPASIECDIIDASGRQQKALLHGVPLTGHPDGVPSMAVAARAVSGQRQLEAAVVEREAALRELEAERQETRALLGKAHARQQQLERTLHALETRYQTDLEARGRELDESIAACAVAEAACRQALADRQQSVAALEDLAARHLQLTTERAAERQRVLELLEAMAVEHRQELAAAQHAPERNRLLATIEERDRLARTLAEQAVRFTALAAHGRQLMPLAFAGRAARDIASRLRQHLERVDDIATGLLVAGVIDSSMRPVLEQMRGEAVQASALVDEILTGVDGQPITELADCPVVSGDERRS